MRNLVLFFALLLAYTFVYIGLSHFWQGVFVIPTGV